VTPLLLAGAGLIAAGVLILGSISIQRRKKESVA
jgi:hypothetical protein